MKRSRKTRPGEPEPRQQLDASLQELRLLLSQAYAGFNAALDSDLVESYIYEIQSLQARYSYVLRQRKALDAAVPAAPAKGRGRAHRSIQDPLPVA